MANILIAIVTLAIGFLLVSYGAYSNYYSTQRTFVASVVGRALERQMIYIDMSKSGLCRFPSVSDLDSNRFTKANRAGIVFTSGTPGSYGLLCALAELRRGWIDDRFQRARHQWPNAFYGDDCNTNA